jgi:hypothetical protein
LTFQNAIFCRELFAQLAKEAIMLQSPIPHMVVGNQITASLFPDIQVKQNAVFSVNPSLSYLSQLFLLDKKIASFLGCDILDQKHSENRRQIKNGVVCNKIK